MYLKINATQRASGKTLHNNWLRFYYGAGLGRRVQFALFN